jgi:SagB-type dehydrogenase family enzyme
MRGLGIDDLRGFLRDDLRQKMDFSKTDQSRGLPAPPIEKPIPEGNPETIDLPDFTSLISRREVLLFEAINNRRSHRVYKRLPINLEELSLLLYSTSGIQKVINPAVALRTVPSAGCRHALETYLCALNVKGLQQAIYRYLPLSHRLLKVKESDSLRGLIVEATLGQSFTGNAAVVFIWTTIPYRMEWRYGIASHKVIALDAGHVCQNLYLSAHMVDCGVCAIAAYDQDKMDNLIDVDGKEEFTIYLAALGKIR